jgi:general secretion pathway protein B
VAAPAAATPDAVRRQDLPENVRQQLPALTVAGATYSENPRYRMVIINGQVVQEGDAAAPGVVLETIRPKEVVLRAQGYRFTEKY